MRRRGGGAGAGGPGGSSSSSFIPAAVAANFKKLDVYPKLQEDYRVKTQSGAAVSLVSGALIFLLVCSELSTYMTTTVKDHVVVDPTIGVKLRINFNVTFHALNCAEVTLDAMDVAGDQQNGIDHDIFKTRIGKDGQNLGDAFRHDMDDEEEPEPLPDDYCGSCYGAIEGKACCNTCDSVKRAYIARGWNSLSVDKTAEQCLREKKHPTILAEKGEGCRIHGYMLVNKVAGNFHVALGESSARDGAHIHQFNPATMSQFNVTHTVHHLSFGQDYPGLVNPLDGTLSKIDTGYGTYQYYIKIIPTIYTGQAVVETNQYSVHTQYQSGIVNGRRQNILPGVFWVYDLSPFMVKVTEHTVPFTHFLTGLCAIAGGVFTVAGIVDSCIFHVNKAVKRASRGRL